MKFLKSWTTIFIIALLLPLAGFGYSTISPVKEIATEAYTLYLNPPYLFVGGYSKMSIFDVNNPASPTLLSEFSVDGLVNGITTVGNQLFIAMDLSGQENLLPVDITNIKTPSVGKPFYAGPQDNKPYSLHSIGRDVYIGFNRDGITVIHVNEDNSLVQTGSLKTDGNIMDMVSYGNRLYASSWNGEIYVVDISDPSALRLVNTITTVDIDNRMDINNDLLAVAEGPSGVTFYNLANPDAPAKIKTVRVSMNECYSVSLRENFCYVARLFYPSPDVTAPSWDGGLSILDYESLSNIKADKIDDLADAQDVIAYDGYVFLAGLGTLNVYKHGPAGIRPTSTPAQPTPTQTFTPSLTPTNTPRLISTATPKLTTPTPVPTNTSVQTSTPPPVVVPTEPFTPTATATQIPAGQTPTPDQNLRPDFIYDFGQSKIAESGWSDTVLGGFSGNPAGFVKIIPLSASYFPQSVDNKGLMFLVSPVTDPSKPDQVCFIYAADGIEIGKNPVLIRAYVKSEGDGGNGEIYIGALKGSFTKGGLDGSIAFNSPKNSKNYIATKRINCYYEPDDDVQMITPFVQIAAKKGGGDATVYIDRIEVYILKPGVKYDGLLFESIY